jgi:hypothetical protein
MATAQTKAPRQPPRAGPPKQQAPPGQHSPETPPATVTAQPQDYWGDRLGFKLWILGFLLLWVMNFIDGIANLWR